MSEQTRLDNIEKSRNAVRLHTECSMQGRKDEWAEKVKERTQAKKAAAKAAPPKKPLVAAPVIAKVPPAPVPDDASWESDAPLKPGAEKKIKSFLFRDDLEHKE
ncbi:MAG: hypothetical protein OSA48_05995 [Akkermansiaceae bacterium]|nr:hypothetical protein [Akkermansiaceae bacterium]|tara:strand:+ start:2366 stop:2677 length:312 start_codon:yes stop_codon:yes gene_type:complete